MKSKSDQSDRPESMLKSIQAALTHYFMATSDSNPFDNDLRNFMTALIKRYTRHAAGRTKIMPIKPISDLFSSWPDNEQLTIKQLRQKTISLLSLGMMARPSDLAPSMGFSRNQIKFNNDRSMTLTLCGIKNDSDRHGFEIKIDSASNPKVDPVSALQHYLGRTASSTHSDGPVFLTCKTPVQPLNARGVSQDLSDVIRLAGLDRQGFTPRSFRPSAATAAIAAGLDPHTTQQIGRWKTKEVFFERYVYPVTKGDFTNKILDSNVQVHTV